MTKKFSVSLDEYQYRLLKKIMKKRGTDNRSKAIGSCIEQVFNADVARDAARKGKQ